MKLQQLNSFKNFWYLPTLHSLFIFDKVTGVRIAEWFCDLKFSNGFCKWSFSELFNTLHENDKLQFDIIRMQWEHYIDTCMRETYNDWAISSGG